MNYTYEQLNNIRDSIISVNINTISSNTAIIDHYMMLFIRWINVMRSSIMLSTVDIQHRAILDRIYNLGVRIFYCEDPDLKERDGTSFNQLVERINPYILCENCDDNIYTDIINANNIRNNWLKCVRLLKCKEADTYLHYDSESEIFY